MNIYKSLFLFFTFALTSCLETEDPDTYNCIDSNQVAAISVISTTQVSDVRAYTDEKILCKSNTELFFKKNKDDQFYHYSYNDEEVDSEYEDWFVKLGCYIKHNASLKSKDVFFQIKKANQLDEIKVDSLLKGKEHIFVISEQDTAWLFSFEISLLNDGDPDYNFSISSKLGCHGGYCFVTLPISEKEFCFDKNNENMKYLFE